MCPVGRYSEAEGAILESTCKPCDVGKYSEAVGQISATVCKDCNEKEYQKEEGKSLCYIATLESFKMNEEVVSARNAQSDNLRAIHKICIALMLPRAPLLQTKVRRLQKHVLQEHIRTNLARWECKRCPAGFSQSNERQSSCNKCNDGEEVVEGIRCEACEEGKFLDTSKTCVNCPDGYFQDSKSQKNCTKCALGYWTGGSDGAKICVEKPVPETERYRPENVQGERLNKSSLLVTFQIDHNHAQEKFMYRIKDRIDDDSQEHSLPAAVKDTEESTCSYVLTPGYDLREELVVLQLRLSEVGYVYWSDRTGTWTIARDCKPGTYLNDLANVESWNCEECPSGAVCRGGTFSDTIGTLQGYWRPTFAKLVFYSCLEGYGDCVGGTFGRNNTWPDVQCQKGHTGPLCAVCVENHARDLTMQCMPCASKGTASADKRLKIQVAVVIVNLFTFSTSFIFIVRANSRKLKEGPGAVAVAPVPKSSNAENKSLLRAADDVDTVDAAAIVKKRMRVLSAAGRMQKRNSRTFKDSAHISSNLWRI